MKTVKKAIEMSKRTMKINLSLARFNFTLAFNLKQTISSSRTLFGKIKIMTRLRSKTMMTRIKKRKKKPSLESIIKVRMSTD